MTDSEELIRQREHEQDLQRLRGLRPIDDDFMRCLFRDNLPLAQMVLRIILDKDDLILIAEETQKDFKRLVGARSLCLDVYGEDSEGRRYDLEVQRADKGARPYRARYHASAMDIENLDAGQEFEELPITYTIFITEHDIYEIGEPLYPVERMNLKTGQPFDDGEHILYVNGAYRGDSALGQLMHDFSCHDADEMYYDELADRTRYFKETPEGVNEMCKAMEDMRTDALNRGIEIGMEQGMERGMKQGMAKGEDLFAKLVALLLQNNRSEDVARAAADADYRHDLFVKYNLS